MNELSFFLGANTYHGFYSLYERYLDAWDGSKVWILKGGAGCGKSGFMRTVGERAASAGLTVHRILCSGDPSSLDGIHIPDLGVILLDGTAPHILEPPLVGDRGFYLDMSRFYLTGVPDLLSDTEIYQEHYRRAYHWLAAAGEAEAILKLPEGAETAIRRKAAALISRELRSKNRKPGKFLSFFTEAFTGEGMYSLREAKGIPAGHQIGLNGVCGAEHAFLSTAAEAAIARGYDVLLSLSPLQPKRISHLFVPDTGFAIGMGKGDRTIHLDRIVFQHSDREYLTLIRETDSLRLALLSRARKELALAKHHHDRLEEAVNPYVDFPGVYQAAEAFAADLLEKGSAGSTMR